MRGGGGGGGEKRRIKVTTPLRNRLTRWGNNDVKGLWLEVVERHKKKERGLKQPRGEGDAHAWCLHYAREGHYGKATQALNSAGIASTNDEVAVSELRKRHPISQLPPPRPCSPPALVVNSDQVLAALKHFPLGSSPGFSQLRVQHLVDVICSNTAPSGRDCLVQLTIWLNLLLSGKAYPGLAPWLCGAQLNALPKPNNGAIDQ